LEQEKERIAQEKLQSLHRLAMGVAHEIRNPMVTIGGFAARIVKDQEACPDSRHYARNILDDARKLERVVDEIQAYCDLPEAKLITARLAPVIQEAIAERVPTGLERNIQIRLHDSIPGDFATNFDPFLLKMAVLSLLDNAVAFSKDGAVVDVYLRLNEEGAELEIRDEGIGIDEQDLEYIFNPFFSTRIHGSGMGLAIVERIVHEHMGKIKVESKRGKGTEVLVSIPYSLERSLSKAPEAGG
jgi:signal transduction histidine kinase